MIDFEILEQCGTTAARLRQLFTAEMPSAKKQMTMDEAAIKEIRKDVDTRKKFEELLQGWIQEGIVFSLQNHKRYSAVDIAWDSVPINKKVFPLLQYAQGRIDPVRAAKDLEAVPNGDTYVKRNDSGQVAEVEFAKFTEMNVNLIRSVITRRTAAQVVKYSNLDPHFKYESRSNTQVGKLLADMTSQRMDIMADQYDYDSIEEQAIRNMFLYTDCVLFPRASWERDVQWSKKWTDPSMPQEKGKPSKENIVEREGLCWVAPHRSRLIYDNQYPLASLNTDTGCRRIGFWDVLRWGDIAKNPAYFNRKNVSYSADTAAWFATYSGYFDQYYNEKITPPPKLSEEMAQNNDRATQVGQYSGNMDDVGVFFTHLWVKINPREWRIGTYPYDIWVHLKCAGDATVVYADIMPSSPAAVFTLNANYNRLDNISVAHELMQYQDQLTNLYSQLLECIKADLFAVAVLNRDVFPETKEGKAAFEEFKQVMSGRSYFTSMQILEASFDQLSRVLGKEITADMVFKVVRSSQNTAINEIFSAITHVVTMAERLMVLSVHEQGQTASHEITASESNQIASSTDTIYSFISNSVDKGRAAMKRICWESFMAKGTEDIELPVANRYPNYIIAKAGFQVKVQESDADGQPGYKMVMGHKRRLVHDYIFSSRDGGNRVSNPHSATVLVQLVQAIGSLVPVGQTAILGAMGKEKLFELVNSIFRMADSGVDLNLELKAGDDNELLVEENQQVMNSIQQMAQALKQNVNDVAQLKQIISQMAQQLQQSKGQAAASAVRESISLNYKDAPPSVRRQMEQAAGFQPASEPEQLQPLTPK